MSDVTPAQTPTAQGPEALAEVFALHSAHLTRFVYDRLERADWHLAEDLTSETFVSLVRNYADRPIRMESAFALLASIARRRIADHYRLRRSGEVAADFRDWFEERKLPTAPAAEEVAAMRLEARELLADRPQSLTAAARRQVEALSALAVAA